ncbi:MAG TPA: SpaA isopeptide-forming pilin-related protein, partial [Lachnospiraceae bacterium]|nr:SpaA isopeptide-forming pilin-related protein [Lachnospiraceae bacterium]
STQNENKSYDFENTKIQAGVKFLKVDADHELLGGAVFHLYRIETDGTIVDFGTVTATANGVVEKQGLGAGSYYFVEETAPTGYVDNTKQYTFTITAADNGTTVGLSNPDVTVDEIGAVVNQPKTGDARLTKVIKGTNTGLAGAKFALYAKGNDTPIKTDLESDANGYVTVTGLVWGEYYFMETSAPSGYALDSDTKYEFEVSADNVSSLIEVKTKDGGNAENELILGKAQLVKYDADTEDVLSGALFDVYDADTQTIVSGYESGILSDVNGVVETNKDLPEGSYYFKERTAPTGYALDTTEYSFTITQDNMDTTVTAGTDGKAYNTPDHGKAELFKYVLGEDGYTKTGLEGAVFKLYKVNSLGPISWKTEIDTYTTDANGIITVTDLLWGEYYFQEETAPTGYERKTGDAGKISFTISATQLDYTGTARFSMSNDDYKGSIKLVKTESGTGDEIEGAVFRLYQISGGTTTEIKNATVSDGTYTTDKNGEINVTDLDWASYYFVEISAPTGYAMPADPTTSTVTITKDNVKASIESPLTIEAENTKVYGNVKLTKIDDATP